MKRLIFTLLLFVVSHVRAEGQGFTPTEALKRMQVPEGFRVRLVACEPMIRQPVTISFDDRGRIWVIQYLQYPNPAGLKPVVVDQYLRTAYDRLPEPPPRGPKGADRITILSDPDGDGHYRKAKDFVTGLNLASGMCLGHGGVFVLQAPYLLFYPDRDGNDVPDGDPEVLLTGFGMEDAHAVGNSLQWGPDGWLYGAQGSTVTAMIRNPADGAAPPIEFQQGICAIILSPSSLSCSPKAAATPGASILTVTATSLPGLTTAAKRCCTRYRALTMSRASASTDRCTILMPMATSSMYLTRISKAAMLPVVVLSTRAAAIPESMTVSISRRICYRTRSIGIL